MGKPIGYRHQEFWFQDTPRPAASLSEAGNVRSDPPASFFVFVFSGPGVSVVAIVLTWKWFTAREKRD